MFGSVWVLHHEIHLLSLLFSIIVFAYFFVTTKESLIIRVLSAALFMFAGNLLCEVPWILGYYLHVGGLVLALDVIEFMLGEIFILYIFDNLRRKGLKLPRVDMKKWLVVFTIAWVSVALLDRHGFYPLWIGYLNGTVLVDPHTVYPFNLDWSIGKAIGMLGWVWIARSEKTGKTAEEADVGVKPTKPIPPPRPRIQGEEL